MVDDFLDSFFREAQRRRPNEPGPRGLFARARSRQRHVASVWITSARTRQMSQRRRRDQGSVTSGIIALTFRSTPVLVITQ